MILNIFVFKYLLCVFEIYPTCCNTAVSPLLFRTTYCKPFILPVSFYLAGSLSCHFLSSSLLSTPFFLSMFLFFFVCLRCSTISTHLRCSSSSLLFSLSLYLLLLNNLKESPFGIIVTILITLVKRTFIINI